MKMQNKYFELEQTSSEVSLLSKTSPPGADCLYLKPEMFIELLRFLGPLTETIDFTKVRAP